MNTPRSVDPDTVADLGYLLVQFGQWLQDRHQTPAAPEAPAPAATEAPAAPETPAHPPMSEQELRTHVRDRCILLSQQGRRDQLLALLARYDVTSVPELTREQVAQFAQLLEELA